MAQIRPSLPAKPGLHLRKAQIIVGVSKDEKVDILPAKGNQKGAHHPPNEEEPARPMRVLMWIARFHARRRALKAPAQRARRAIAADGGGHENVGPGVVVEVADLDVGRAKAIVGDGVKGGEVAVDIGKNDDAHLDTR